MQASSPWQSGNFVKDLFIIFLNFEPTLASFGQNLNVCGQILQKILTSGRTVFDILFVILGESWYPYSVHQGHGGVVPSVCGAEAGEGAEGRDRDSDSFPHA